MNVLKTKEKELGLPRTISDEKLEQLLTHLPFTLTVDQKEAVEEIKKI